MQRPHHVGRQPQRLDRHRTEQIAVTAARHHQRVGGAEPGPGPRGADGVRDRDSRAERAFSSSPPAREAGGERTRGGDTAPPRREIGKSRTTRAASFASPPKNGPQPVTSSSRQSGWAASSIATSGLNRRQAEGELPERLLVGDRIVPLEMDAERDRLRLDPRHADAHAEIDRPRRRGDDQRLPLDEGVQGQGRFPKLGPSVPKSSQRPSGEPDAHHPSHRTPPARPSRSPSCPCSDVTRSRRPLLPSVGAASTSSRLSAHVGSTRHASGRIRKPTPPPVSAASLQAAKDAAIERTEIREDHHRPPRAQRLLDRPQGFLHAARPNHDEPIERHAELGRRRRVEFPRRIDDHQGPGRLREQMDGTQERQRRRPGSVRRPTATRSGSRS